MVQNKNKTVKALAKALITFTHKAACEASPPAKRVKNLPSKRKNGAPGGCPTSSLKQERIYSPQSQNEEVGSIVQR